MRNEALENGRTPPVTEASSASSPRASVQATAANSAAGGSPSVGAAAVVSGSALPQALNAMAAQAISTGPAQNVWVINHGLWAPAGIAGDPRMSPIAANRNVRHSRSTACLRAFTWPADHAVMQAVHQTALGMFAAALLGPAFAGESAAGRVLLQPPREVIASPINDRFAVRLLYFAPQIDNAVRFDTSAGVAGTRIDIEDVLGQADSDHLGTLDLMFRIGARHRIHADFFQLHRNGEAVVAQQVRFGDQVYNGGSRLVSGMDLRKLGLTYTYSLLQRQRVELAAGVGVHLLQLNGTVANPATFASEDLDTAGPFAAVVGSATWRITRRFSMHATGQYLDLQLSDVRGAFRAFRGDLQYRAWRNLAIGAGYSYSRYLVDSTGDDFRGFYRLEYMGPEAFFRVSF